MRPILLLLTTPEGKLLPCRQFGQSEPWDQVLKMPSGARLGWGVK